MDNLELKNIADSNISTILILNEHKTNNNKACAELIKDYARVTIICQIIIIYTYKSELTICINLCKIL